MLTCGSAAAVMLVAGVLGLAVPAGPAASSETPAPDCTGPGAFSLGPAKIVNSPAASGSPHRDFDLGSGAYRVTLYSQDPAHEGGANTVQLNERWSVRVYGADGRIVYESPAIADLPEDQVTMSQVVDPVAEIDGGRVVQARHPLSAGDPGSVVPLCAVFEPIGGALAAHRIPVQAMLRDGSARFWGRPPFASGKAARIFDGELASSATTAGPTTYEVHFDTPTELDGARVHFRGGLAPKAWPWSLAVDTGDGRWTPVLDGERADGDVWDQGAFPAVSVRAVRLSASGVAPGTDVVLDEWELLTGGGSVGGDAVVETHRSTEWDYRQGSVVLVVRAWLADRLRPEIDRWVADLEAERRQVIVLEVAEPDAVQLRASLKAIAAERALGAVVLVGDLPWGWVEVPPERGESADGPMATDALYSALSSEWVDGDGDGVLDGVADPDRLFVSTAVSRIAPAAFARPELPRADRVRLVRDVLDENHAYRTGTSAPYLPDRALAVLDDGAPGDGQRLAHVGERITEITGEATGAAALLDQLEARWRFAEIAARTGDRDGITLHGASGAEERVAASDVAATTGGAEVVLLDAPYGTSSFPLDRSVGGSMLFGPGETAVVVGRSDGDRLPPPGRFYDYLHALGLDNAVTAWMDEERVADPDARLRQVVGLSLLGDVSVPVRPLNDTFPELLSGPSGRVTGSIVHASRDVDEPRHGGQPADASVWFDWTAPFDGPVTFTVEGDFESAVLGLRYDDGHWGSVRTGTGGTTVTERLDHGTHVTVVVDTVAGDRVPFVLSWDQPAAEVPANDDRVDAQAIVLPPDSRVTLAGTTVGATPEPGEEGVHTVWYRTTVPAAGVVAVVVPYRSLADPTLPVGGESVSADVKVFDASGSLLASGGSVWWPPEFSDDPAGGQSVAHVRAAPGTDLWISVTGWPTGGTPFTLAVEHLPNDDVVGARTLAAPSGLLDDDTELASHEPGEADHDPRQLERSLWYRFTAPSDGTLSLPTLEVEWGTLVAAVYDEGDQATPLVRWRSGQPREGLALASGQTVLIAVEPLWFDLYDWEYETDGPFTMGWAFSTAPLAGRPSGAGDGYVVVDEAGTVSGFGALAGLSGPVPGAEPVVDVAATPDGTGAWVLDRAGAVTPVGRAVGHGDLATVGADGRAVAIASTPDGGGYWIVTDHGRVVAFGSARAVEDLLALGVADQLNGPVIDAVATPTGGGIYLVAADGGVFSLGDAAFHGSMGGRPLNGPVDGLVPDPDGNGYWLVARDGGVFGFDAAFRGSMGGRPLNAPVVGMVAYGDGYAMVGADGGVFVFADRPFVGSLGAGGSARPIVAIAAA